MTNLPALAISPLRQRLLDDMAMRRFGRETQHYYIRDVERFATWLGRSPHTATAEEVRSFQIEQQEAGMPVPTMNMMVSALRFFFTQTLDRPDLSRKLVRTRYERKIPTVLSMEEVKRLLEATTSLKHQAALSVAYGAGLRSAEVSKLKISDIDSKRMLLRIERGKGGRYRNAISRPHLSAMRHRGPVRRRGRPPLPDGDLVADIRALIADLPTYGYRRVHALLRRQAERDGRPPPNAKRVYRVMKLNRLLLQRHSGRGAERRHDGRVAVDNREAVVQQKPRYRRAESIECTDACKSCRSREIASNEKRQCGDNCSDERS